MFEWCHRWDSLITCPNMVLSMTKFGSLQTREQRGTSLMFHLHISDCGTLPPHIQWIHKLWKVCLESICRVVSSFSSRYWIPLTNMCHVLQWIPGSRSGYISESTLRTSFIFCQFTFNVCLKIKLETLHFSSRRQKWTISYVCALSSKETHTMEATILYTPNCQNAIQCSAVFGISLRCL